mmetsp:Transcript_18415/g.25964  ORF Transcript_18415/g.25964 Transcript_18415/m.25964 type:complete len:165 (-) Transcript_18415:1232-1726(-)
MISFRATAIRRMAASTASKHLTPAEREKVLHEANEKMRSYYVNRPPIEVLRAKRRVSQQRNGEHAIQKVLLAGFLMAFLATPFFGKRIATDKEFKEKWIPSWYDYSIDKPKSEWTREDFHDQLVKTQTELHQRAIRGEFEPAKLEALRSSFKAIDTPETDDDDE